ncbi:TraR/DksA family transcriptional regulator [Thiobacter aerophilum]|uniref:TraR/DksA C4-type zinc finger protein n=1 Tax=Thiobacter aerophilum TaxID=3121275 RepID=A0ABV0EBY9_9BURK
MSVLTKKELQTLEKRLQEEYQRVLEAVRDELERSGQQQYIELAGRVTDTGDESVADMLADLNAAMIDRHVRELRELEAARARLAQGSYGVCVDCGAPVGYERLKANPAAARCFVCQTKRDQLYAHEGRPKL